ncbi:MAG: hypothetical protein K2H47_11255 [Muribaculaceae bacterium]|nr:hypothetical protein [Muribaculaceae bacterium]
MKIWILVWRCIILVVIAAGSALLCMCGHKDGGTVSNTDSDTTVIKPATEDTVVRRTGSRLPILTSDSLGAVRIGMAIDSLPPVHEAFYDSIGQIIECEYKEYVFSRRGEPMFAVIDFGEGKVDLITLMSPEIGVVAGTTELHIGDTFDKLLAQRATQAEWAGYDAVGRWTWTNGGVWYMPDENLGNSEAAQKLLKHLYDSMAAPDPEDFPDHVTIGYIGTGLPF